MISFKDVYIFSTLLIRSCPSLTLIYCHFINCLPSFVAYHPRYLLSSIDVSCKQYWLAINDQKNIRLINTLGNYFLFIISNATKLLVLLNFYRIKFLHYK